jgi:hypothetical protein
MTLEVNGREEVMPVEIIDDSIIEVANKAEARINAINKIKSIVLRVTNSNDWIDQGGKPYLAVSGAEKVGGLFGIKWSIGESQLTNEEDGHYSYTYKGKFTMGQRTIEFEGSRSTKDPFFSKAHGKEKPVSEIDRNDVKKAALTNLIGNGITRMLGIRNMTWDEVKAGGVDQSKTSKVEYGKAEMSDDVKEQRKKLGEMLMEMAGNNKDLASKMLVEFTSFVAKDGKVVAGKDSITKLSEKAIPVTYGKVSKEYEQWKKEEADEGQEVMDDFDKAEAEGKV